MMALALVLRPWLRGLQDLGVRGRGLADDLRVSVDEETLAACHHPFTQAMIYTG